MLVIHKDVVPVKVTHNFAEDDVVKDLTAHACKQYWATIGWVLLIALLKDGCNIDLLPVFRKSHQYALTAGRSW